MSVKRQATNELNHDNWDQDDPSEHEEMGVFKTASKDVLEKRVIRTAKRRTQAQSGDEAKKGVFSGFGGFNKSQPSSFDFLANLTNGKANGTTTSKSEIPASTGLFSNKPTVGSSGSSLFSIPVTSSVKSTFGSSTISSIVFGGSTTTTTQSPFGTFKTQTTTTDDSPFKTQKSANSNNDGSNDVLKSTNANTENSSFGLSFTNSNKSTFSNNSANTSPFKLSNTIGNAKTTPFSSEDKNEEKKMTYYSKLKGLNESVSDWIKKHVEETPLCILTPIFKDYEKHLKEIQDEFHSEEKETKKLGEDNALENKPAQTEFARKQSVSVTNTNSSLFSSTKPSIFSNQTNTSSPETTTSFSFGIKQTPNSTTSSGGFSFGISSAQPTTNTISSSNGPPPFSFSSDKPFSFSSNISQKPSEPAKEENDEDEPPKVEFTPVVEENSVYDKKCKVFVKKDGNFIDKGVGTLYIKKVQDSDKHQLLVRANTNLGNVLLNLILTSSIPTQRLGKNNVMLACIPTPDAKPPPTPVLIRVKTSEEADELLKTLDKHKV